MKLQGPWLTRKDIARMCNVSTWQVFYNERRWGIDGFRKHFNKRVVLYAETPTLAALRAFGVLRSGTAVPDNSQ